VGVCFFKLFLPDNEVKKEKQEKHTKTTKEKQKTRRSFGENDQRERDRENQLKNEVVQMQREKASP
jgi:hypothetical protein